MLIKDLIKQFKKFWPWLLAGTLILGIIGILWGSFFTQPFKSSLSIDVIRSGTQKVQEYKYDGY